MSHPLNCRISDIIWSAIEVEAAEQGLQRCADGRCKHIQGGAVVGHPLPPGCRGKACEFDTRVTKTRWRVIINAIRMTRIIDRAVKHISFLLPSFAESAFPA